MARDIGLEIHYTRDPKNLVPGINITNYEMLEQFEPDDFGEEFTPELREQEQRIREQAGARR